MPVSTATGGALQQSLQNMQLTTHGKRCTFTLQYKCGATLHNPESFQMPSRGSSEQIMLAVTVRKAVREADQVYTKETNLHVLILYYYANYVRHSCGYRFLLFLLVLLLAPFTLLFFPFGVLGTPPPAPAPLAPTNDSVDDPAALLPSPSGCFAFRLASSSF